MSAWPPFAGAGIKVTHISADFRQVDVELGLKFWNRNYVGVHFGGSLYSMTDPFYMLMVMENLGPDYIVWDKAAAIKFRKPGRGQVQARFRLSEEELRRIREEVARDGRSTPVFCVAVMDQAQDVVAEVEKTLSVKLKS